MNSRYHLQWNHVSHQYRVVEQRAGYLKRLYETNKKEKALHELLRLRQAEEIAAAWETLSE